MSPLIVDATGNDLTFRINGAAMAVHNRLGPGYKEEIYEKALYKELQKMGISVEIEYSVSVVDQEEVVGIFYLDLFVEGQVVVEIKALSHQLTNDDRAQVINYLRATQAPVGLLYNFGRRRLEYQRILPAKSENPVQRLGRDDIQKRGRGVRN